MSYEALSNSHVINISLLKKKKKLGGEKKKAENEFGYLKKKKVKKSANLSGRWEPPPAPAQPTKRFGGSFSCSI